MRSIKTHLTVALLLCILLPSGLIGTTAYWLVFNGIKENRLNEARQIVDARYEQMHIRLLDYNANNKTLLDTLIAVCGYSDLGINACAETKIERFAATNQAVGVSFHSGSDTDIAVGSDAVPFDKLNHRLLPGQIAVTSVSKANGAALLSMPMTDPASGFSVVVTYPGQTFQDIFATSPNHGQFGEAFLTDKQGVFVTQSLGSSQQETIKHLSTLPMQRCLGKENNEILDFDYRNIPVIHGFRFVPEIGGGCIMAHIDQTEAFAPLYQWSRRLGVLAVFFVSAAGLIATIVARGLTKPVLSPAGMADAFAPGDATPQALSTSYRDITESSQMPSCLAERQTSEYDLKKADVECRPELDKQLRKYHSVIQNMGEGFLLMDREGCLIDVNSAYVRASGYSEADLIGMRVADLENQARSEESAEHIRKIMQNGTEVFETQHRRKDGSVWDSEVYACFIEEDGGYFAYLFRNISERKRAGWLLNKLQDNQVELAMQGNKLQHLYNTLAKSDDRYADLLGSAPMDDLKLTDKDSIAGIPEHKHMECQLQHVQKMEVLGQLIGGIAHDFNNIMAAILGYSNLALERCVPGPPDKLNRYLSEVISASERARDLIAVVLAFNRTPSTAANVPLDLASELEKAVHILSFAIPAGIEINTHIEPNVPPVRIHPIELQQVLINLSVNARDAIDEQGRIDITLERVRVNNKTCAICNTIMDGDYVALEVKDNGNGIPANIQHHIFEPFFTTKEDGKGSGLGLNMVQEIVAKNNAHLLVESGFKQGASFRLLFSAVQETGEAIPTSSTSTSNAPVAKHWRVWVVEDHEPLAAYYRMLLQKQGYVVTVFTDPTKALHAFQLDSGGVDLVLSDQTMPYLSGQELATAMLAVKPELPVILISGYSETANADEVKRLGIRCYLSKPVDGKKLLDILASELCRSDFA